MKKLGIILSLILVANVTAQENHFSCKHLSDTYRLMKNRDLNYPGDERYDVTYYKLDLKIDINPNFVEGKVFIDALSTIDNLQSLFVDLSDNMSVAEVKMDQTPVTFIHADDRINITLDRAYNQGESLSLSIEYSGTPQNNGFGSFVFDVRDNGEPVIWSLSEPYGSMEWWACKDTPADKADSSDVWITCEEYFTAVSNGNLIDIVDLGNGYKTYKWKNSYPIAQYLISIAMANYTVYSDYFEYGTGDSMLVIHYSYPENFDMNRQALLDKTVPMLEIFSGLFGEYPFIREKYGHAEVTFSGGMEHQTISSMGSYNDWIIAHELAHQWFGDKITCIDWHNIWLNEGFATYSECLFAEAYYGWDSYMNRILAKMGAPDQYWTAKAAEGSIYVQDITSVPQIFNSARSYNKAAIVLHMLRGVVGDELFFEILNSYSEDPQLEYGVASTEDFQLVAEEVSNTDLEYFFDQWIYGENYPSYSYNFEYSPISQNSYSININLIQDNNSYPAFFTMPLDIKIQTASGDTLVRVFNDQQTQTFGFTLFDRPLSIEIDPENWILKDATPLSRIPEEEMLNDYFISQNYPNPFNPATSIVYAIPESGNVEILLYDILGNKIAELVNEFKNRGRYAVNLSSKGLASGTYFYRMIAGDFSSTKKLTVIK